MDSTELNPLSEPCVSVIICNYNYGAFLERALVSAVEQSYPCEVVVVDDGSTDDSRAILERWQSRVKVILRPNGGQRLAYDTGLANCRGDIVIFLDSDDYLYTHAAATVAQAFGRGVAKVHYRLALVDEHGKDLGGRLPTLLSRGDLLPSLMKNGLLYASAPGSGNAYRRDVLLRLFPLPTHDQDRHGADFFCIYGSIAFGEVRAIDQVLGNYRVQTATLDGSGFVFGNAASRSDPRTRFAERERQFRSWIAERTDGRVVVPPLLDFSHAKTLFVQETFKGSYLQGLRDGGAKLVNLMRALWLHGDFSWRMKTGLSAWALTVLLSPRIVGRPLARYVSNPASRGANRRERLAAT